MSAQPSPARADSDPIPLIRHFNRFYTRQIGVLREGLLQTQFSLTEVRVLYEIANHDHLSAAELARELALDPGYLSRILGLMCATTSFINSLTFLLQEASLS